MTATSRMQAAMIWIALVVTALAVANGFVRSDGARAGTVGIATIAVVWLVVALTDRLQCLATQSESERRFVSTCAIAASLLLAASLGSSLLRGVGIADEAFVQRANGMSWGIVLAVIGNAVPKIVGPFCARRCTHAQLQSDQRFAGWAFTLAGLVYASAWLVAPIPLADTVSTIACASALVVVLGRLAWRLA